MCVIFHLEPNATLNRAHFFNAVYNNPHGYGLVLKDGNGQLQCIKNFNAEGTDPEEVWKLLEDNKDIERVLHIRWSTKGATDETNVQPFEVFNSGKRRVFFFHNGTLSQYGVADKSDTLDFAEKKLSPMLLRFSGTEGKGDYTDPFFIEWLEKIWMYTSKGLLFSSDLTEHRFGNGWTKYVHPDSSSSGSIWVSNTDYFQKVSRGPMFQKMEEARKRAEEEEKAKQKTKEVSVVDNGDVTPWRGVPQRSSEIIKAWEDVLNYWSKDDDPENISQLKYSTFEEILAAIESSDQYTLAAWMTQLVRLIGTLHEDATSFERKWKSAEATIRIMKNATDHAQAA